MIKMQVQRQNGDDEQQPVFGNPPKDDNSSFFHPDLRGHSWGGPLGIPDHPKSWLQRDVHSAAL
jgi:hypothetical protein